MNHPLQCRCGTIKGYVANADAGRRAICYCKDCQAFARFLRQAETILDAAGGTRIVATTADNIHFSQGLDSVACMSLSNRGLLRWYAGCCNTPIGNTPRDFKVPYIGLIENILQSGAPSVEESFGPTRIVLNVQSARIPVKSSWVGTTLAMVRVMAGVITARLRGGHKRNALFQQSTGAPVVAPRELSKAEREAVT
jgi:Family of unknown function (DUF6151)